MKDVFEKTPYLGFYNQKCKKFIDNELFDLNHRNYIKLKKVKIWYGYSDPDHETIDEKISGKNILGIQCEYLDSISGEIKSSGMNCGIISHETIETEVLDLSNNDYITKLIICYNNIISYIKLETKLNKKLELGTFDKNIAKTLKLNSNNEPYIVISFYGYYNELGLRALGCNYVSRDNFLLFNFIDYFRYRLFLGKNKEEKEKWTEDKIHNLTRDEQVFIRICLLPNALLFNIIKYYL